jgi:hypothetical protein
LATLPQAHPTLESFKAAAKALLDAIAGAILTHTFITYTVGEHVDEDMEINPHSHPVFDLA